MLKPIERAVIFSMCLFLTVGVSAQESTAQAPTETKAPDAPTLTNVLDELAKLKELMQTTSKTAKEAKDSADKAAAAVTARPAPAAPTLRVHLLLICQNSDPEILTGFLAGAQRIESLFRTAFTSSPVATLASVVLIGDDERATDRNIMAGLQSIPPLGAQDIFVCWYCMHGQQVGPIQVLGTQEQRTAILGPTLAQQPVNALIDVRSAPGAFFGHYFASEDAGNNVITRINLWMMMLSKKASYTLMFSDTCFPGTIPRTAPAPAPAIASFTGNQLHFLLTEYTGTVNMTSSSVGQYSFYFPNTPGIFTSAFFRIAAADSQDDWATFNSNVARRTHEVFDAQVKGTPEARGQTDQVPQVFILDITRRQ